ncbi:MAG: TetR/AcrR family transcriptional regulator [Mycobacterium sp.]
MLHSAMLHSDAYEAFRDFMRGYVLAAISGVLGEGPDTALRANLAGTNLVGTALLRYVMRVGPLADLGTDEVVGLDRAQRAVLSDRGRGRTRLAAGVSGVTDSALPDGVGRSGVDDVG